MSAQQPRYRDVVERLRAAILQGEYAVGSALPTQTQLAEDFGVSRDTIQQAIAQLQAEGLVETQRRRGTIVRHRRTVRRRWSPDIPRGGPYTDWHGEPIEGHRMDIRRVEVVQADAELAAWLEVPEGSEVTIRRRHWLVDDEPIQLFDSFFPRDVVRGTPLDGPTGAKHGSYAALDDAGHRPAMFSEEITARMPTPDEAATLRPGERIPVFEVRRTTRDAEGMVVEGLRVVAGADRNILAYEDIVIPADADLT